MPPFEIDRLAVVSLRTQDLPATVHFYRDVIGLTRLVHHGRRPAFDLGYGQYLVILADTAVQDQAAHGDRFPILAFAVADLDRAVEQLQRHQVEMPWRVEVDGHSRWVMFYDPGGNLIEFVQFDA